ncbi:MAG TPA: response regulator [Sphingobacteriaceae bacterium]
MGLFKHNSVLLIDDSYIDNLINRKILENNKFAENIVVIDSPQEAINYLRNKQTAGEEFPEVIFLDLRMPGMSGFELLQELHSIIGHKAGSIKIFVLSSSLDPSDLKRAQENSLVTRFIGKPLTNKILEEI